MEATRLTLDQIKEVATLLKIDLKDAFYLNITYLPETCPRTNISDPRIRGNLLVAPVVD